MSSPIRSPRSLYRINAVTRPGPNNTEIPVLCRFKRSVGDWLGLIPVRYDDPIFNGTFTGTGLNQGARFRKRVGGYRAASYVLVARTQFVVQELVLQPNGTYQPVPKSVRTISLGFPSGHSVTEIVEWLGGLSRVDEIDAIVTPAGSRIALDGAA